MRKRDFLSFLLAGSLTLASSGCVKVERIEPTGPTQTTATAPAEVRPQDDYYYYINKDSVDHATFVYGTSTAADAFDDLIVQNQVKDIVREVLRGTDYEAGSEEDIIRKAYHAYMDYDFDNSPAPQDLVDLLNRIDSASSVEELMEIDAILVRDYALDGILNFFVTNDEHRAGQNILKFHQLQSVLVANFTEVRESDAALDQLKQGGLLISRAMGHEGETAEASGSAVAYLALDIYEATDLEALDDPFGHAVSEDWSFEKACSNFRSFDLKKYLSDSGLTASAIGMVNITDPGQFEKLGELFTETNLEALKIWEMGRLFTKYRRFLVSSSSYEELMGFVQLFYVPKEEQVFQEILEVFYEQTDPLYVERYYTDEMDEALVSMCDDIKGGYEKLIREATWLSEPTRDELLRKLNNLTYITGKDVKRHNNADFRDISGENYYELYRDYLTLMKQQSFRRLTRSSAEDPISMPMQMFNAQYDPCRNLITITVSITNAPFFDSHADYFTNLGGLGFVIAHEMGHAFDSDCILYDSRGVYDPSWIPQEDMDALLERNEKAASYFEQNFTIFGLYHVDGEATLGENYADLGAMECISSLARSDEDLRKLFTNFAACWCSMKTDTAIIDQLAYDVHSPEVIRVNAILSTLPAFIELYDVQEGDGMYIPPEKRISRWH
ncbi:MAG: M13 family metallopeptidase [Clostridiales bacterium]|nr:M13 family metallopeptidase [Clostridiales bacterium]